MTREKKLSKKSFSKLKHRTESPIVTACCDYLDAKRYFFWRQNNTGVKRTDKSGREFWSTPKHSRKGVPDIFVLKLSGEIIIYADNQEWAKRTTKNVPVIIALEVKTQVGRQSPDQKEFQRDWEKNGGIYLIIRSVDDLIKEGF